MPIVAITATMATMPTVLPSMRAKPTMMFFALSGWISKKSPSSTTFRISSFMSYGWFALAGTSVFRLTSSRSAGSELGRTGAFSRFDSGR